MPNKRIAAIILLLMVMAQIGTDVYLASLPAMQLALKTSTHLVQYTFSVFLAGFAISQLFYGPLSDRFGRKFFILFGLVVYSLMSIWCIVSTNISELLLARFIQGIGAGACTVIARSIMRDVFDGRDLDKMNIYQSMVWSMVPISAPLLGGYIQQYLGWRYNFLFLSACSVVVLLICWIKLPETLKAKESALKFKQVLFDYKSILCTKSFMLNLIFSACVISLFAVFNVSAPLIIQVLFKQTAVIYGWSVFSVAITFLLGSIISRSLIHKLLPHQLMCLGLSMITLAGFVMLVINSIIRPSMYSFLLPMMFVQVGCAIAFPSAAAETMRPFTQKTGKAAALFGSILFLGSAISSGIMSHLSENTLIPFSLMIFILALIMLSAYVFIFKHYKKTRRLMHD